MARIGPFVATLAVVGAAHVGPHSDALFGPPLPLPIGVEADGYDRRREIEAVFRRHAAGLRRTQNPTNGCWFQVVDKGQRPDNWTDTSGSAMFVYALQRGIDLGLIDEATYGPVVMRGYQGIVSFAQINERGLVDISQACDGLGVQVDYDHYINRAQVVNAKETVVGFLWATEIVERSRLGKIRAQVDRARPGR